MKIRQDSWLHTAGPMIVAVAIIFGVVILAVIAEVIGA